MYIDGRDNVTKLYGVRNDSDFEKKIIFVILVNT